MSFTDDSWRDASAGLVVKVCVPVSGAMQMPVSGDVVVMVRVRDVLAGVIVVMAGVMPGAMHVRTAVTAMPKTVASGDKSTAGTKSTSPAIAAPAVAGFCGSAESEECGQNCSQ